VAGSLNSRHSASIRRTRALLNGPRADLIAAGAALRALSNEIVAMAPNDRPPATLGKFPNQLDHPYSGLDYSGMCCSPAGVLYQFGGGHVASVMGDVRSNDGTGWKSEYPPIPWQGMRVAERARSACSGSPRHVRQAPGHARLSRATGERRHHHVLVAGKRSLNAKPRPPDAVLLL